MGPLFHERAHQLRISYRILQWETGDEERLIIQKFGVFFGQIPVAVHSGAQGGKGAGVGIELQNLLGLKVLDTVGTWPSPPT